MTLFTEGKYENETFENVEWRDELEDIEFFHCVFRNSSFQSSRFVECSFDQCEFIQCNLSLLEIEHTSFLDAVFSDCKMIGVSWSATGGFLSAEYERSILNNNIFADMNLTRFTFSGCSFVEASFHNTKLKHAVFDDCDMSGCRFSQADRFYDLQKLLRGCGGQPVAQNKIFLAPSSLPAWQSGYHFEMSAAYEKAGALSRSGLLVVVSP